MSMRRLLATTGLALVATTVFATDSTTTRPRAFEEAQSRVVHFGDLDVQTRDGVKTLYRRIELAARAVCGESESPTSPIPLPAWRTCVAEAIRSAVARANQPPLTRYYAELHPRSSLLRIADR